MHLGPEQRASGEPASRSALTSKGLARATVGSCVGKSRAGTVTLPCEKRERSTSYRGRRALIRGDEAADRHASEVVEPAQSLLEGLAADVLEQAVDAARQRGLELLGEVRRPMVDAGGVAELVDGVGAFLRPAGDADGARAGGVRKLPNHRAVGLASPAAVIAGFCVVGLGLANMVPAVFSASAAAASSPSLGIAMAATLAYASNLIGPPIFGAVASVSSLRAAFAMLLPVSLAILALACVQRRRLSSDL